ncbi:MAG: hypothetical protein AMXMBFR57_10260 [Acidimicrobiia bacterium]
MAASRLSLRLAIPATLILLVLLLGTLQYRWLGQVSEAERAQLGRSLTQRASEFGAEFDREMSLASSMLAIDGEALDADPWGAIAVRYDAWRARALYPALVKGVYIASGHADTHTLARWSPDSRTGGETGWPTHFEAVQRALAVSAPRIAAPASAAGEAKSGAQVRVQSLATMALSPVVDAVPALIIPIVSRPTQLPGVDHNVMVAVRFATTDFLVVELDRGVLEQSLIPNLAERFFPATGSDHYRLAILDRQREPVFVRGFEPQELTGQIHVDASSVFFTGNRYEFNARVLAESTALLWETSQRRSGFVASETIRVAPTPANGSMSLFIQERSGTPQPARVALNGWQILVQHGAGSLDEAVAQARTRNLATSFGILGVLLAGVGLIVVNARKAERLAAQQMEFVATVSHELRTPLAVIRSAGQNLSAGVVEDPEQARRYGQLIETEGRRLTDMVEEVLEFAGLSGNRRPLALRPADLSLLITDVIASHQPQLDAAGMRVELDTPATFTPVMADEEALRRAVSNLVGNAIKYAASGGWLGITLRRVEDEAPAIRIEVADHGPGITSEDAAQVFEPFYRGRHAVDQQIHGNGLGLSLVARIAEAHGGTASVSETPGGGATFTLKFPAVDVPAHD